MKRAVAGFILGLLPLPFAASCGADSDLALPDLSIAGDLAQPPLCSDEDVGDAGIPATWSHVQRIFDDHCVGCHCCNDPVDLTSGKSYAALVGRSVARENGTDETCGGVLVTPGDPGHSYLFEKISSSQPCAGQQMPFSEFQITPLPACQQDLVRRWILDGALMQ